MVINKVKFGIDIHQSFIDLPHYQGLIKLKFSQYEFFSRISYRVITKQKYVELKLINFESPETKVPYFYCLRIDLFKNRENFLII